MPRWLTRGVRHSRGSAAQAQSPCPAAELCEGSLQAAKVGLQTGRHCWEACTAPLAGACWAALSRPPQPTTALTKVRIQLPERSDQLRLLLSRLLRGGGLDEARKLGQDVQAAAMQG